jgi:Holliday junction resolvase YEN1
LSFSFWDLVGEGSVCRIADLAAAHYAEHKRPLRIAVDEADGVSRI